MAGKLSTRDARADFGGNTSVRGRRDAGSFVLFVLGPLSPALRDIPGMTNIQFVCASYRRLKSRLLLTQFP